MCMWCMYAHICFFMVDVPHIFVMVHVFTHLPFCWYLVVHVCVCCQCMCMWCMYADICSWWCMYMYVTYGFFLVDVAHIFVMIHVFTHLPFWWYLVVHVCVCCPCMCMWCMYADICSWWCMYMYVVHESSYVFGGGCGTCIYYGELGISYFFGGIWWCMYVYVVHVCSHMFLVLDVAHIFVMVHVFTHLPFWWYLVVHVCVCCPCMCLWCMYADICSWWCIYMYMYVVHESSHMILVVDVAHVFIYHCVPNWLLSKAFNLILSLCTQLTPFKYHMTWCMHCVPNVTAFKTIWPNFIIVYPMDSCQDHLT